MFQIAGGNRKRTTAHDVDDDIDDGAPPTKITTGICGKLFRYAVSIIIDAFYIGVRVDVY